MLIKQDPVTKLWVREDGAVLMPPSGRRFKKFRWTFGCKLSIGYRVVGYKGRLHYVHQLVCRAFHGLPPKDKPFCDHINRIRDDNRIFNIRFVSAKENQDNQASVDRSVEMYGARFCEDKRGYLKAYREAHPEERKASNAAYYKAHCEERKADNAAKAAKMKAQGLVYRKGPNGKFGWYPKNNTTNQKE